MLEIRPGLIDDWGTIVAAIVAVAAMVVVWELILDMLEARLRQSGWHTFLNPDGESPSDPADDGILNGRRCPSGQHPTTTKNQQKEE